MKIDNIEIKWLGHAGFLIKNSKVIYIDPYNIKEQYAMTVDEFIQKVAQEQAE